MIEDKYPDLRESVFIARSKFNAKFLTSLKTIIDILSKNKKQFKIINEDLDKVFDKVVLGPKHTVIDTIEKIDKRAEGEMESPYIETLLMYNPIYNKYPLKELRDGFKKIFISDGSGKAKGISFEISVPKSWKSKEAWRPNIVRKFISQNSHGLSMVMVIIKKLPIPDDMILTNNDIKEYFITEENMKTVPGGSILRDYGEFIIENLPAYWQRLSNNGKRGNNKINMELIQYNFFYKNRMIAIQCQTGVSVDGYKSKTAQLKEYEKFRPLFQKILNSFVLLDMYK